MASGYFSVSSGQAEALLKHLNATLGTSIDASVKKYGQEEAFRLHTLRDRLERHVAKDGAE